MKLGGIIGGILLILAGAGFFIYYEINIKPGKDALEMITEARMVAERGDRDSINNSINIFTRIIAKYQDVPSAANEVGQAYFLIANSYEKLNLNRLAYLKYVYLLKFNYPVSKTMADETKARIARLKVMKNQTEEGVDQMLGLLNNSTNNDFRSRVYAELGHSYLTAGEFRKSLKMFDISINENGSNEEAILGKARSYKRLGDDNKAYDMYEYFLKYYGNFSTYSRDVRRSYLSQVYSSGHYSYSRGEFARAVSFFTRLLNYFPGDPKTENALYWIGESYFSNGKYESAIDYFSRTLSNSFTHKDQDARIKKGYSYFMMKKFDLAAREFQIYMDSYPKGKFTATAKKWKDMSTKEIMYRINNKTLDRNNTDETEEPVENDANPIPNIDESVKPDEVSDSSGEMDDYDNVAEL